MQSTFNTIVSNHGVTNDKASIEYDRREVHSILYKLNAVCFIKPEQQDWFRWIIHMVVENCVFTILRLNGKGSKIDFWFPLSPCRDSRLKRVVVFRVYTELPTIFRLTAHLIVINHEWRRSCYCFRGSNSHW